jgi:hypothetical protein
MARDQRKQAAIVSSRGSWLARARDFCPYCGARYSRWLLILPGAREAGVRRVACKKCGKEAIVAGSTALWSATAMVLAGLVAWLVLPNTLSNYSRVLITVPVALVAAVIVARLTLAVSPIVPHYHSAVGPGVEDDPDPTTAQMTIRFLGVIVGILMLVVPFLDSRGFLDSAKANPKLLGMPLFGLLFIAYGFGGERLIAFWTRPDKRQEAERRKRLGYKPVGSAGEAPVGSVLDPVVSKMIRAIGAIIGLLGLTWLVTKLMGF